MPTITKNRKHTAVTGRIFHTNGTVSYSDPYFDRMEYDTTTSPYPPGGSYWKHELYWSRGGTFNGGPHPNGTGRYDKVPTATLSYWELPGIGAPPGVPTLTSLATKLLADTNPNTPYVDIPVFIVELPEMARLLRIEGGLIEDLFRAKKHLRGLAQLNLEYQFGWRPFFSDLKKLLSFQKQVIQRTNYLKELRDKGYKSFKRTLYKGANANSYYHRTLGGNVWEGYLLSIWGYVVWRPDGDLLYTNEELHNLADRAVHGLYVDFASSWKAIPWAWLVDWCTNIGTFLDANRNWIPMKHSTPQLMVHMKRQAQHDRINSAWGVDYHLEPGVYTHETKERFIVSSSLPEAKLPYLTEGQLSILGSIGVLNRKARGIIS